MTNEEAMALGARCDLCPLRGAPVVPPAPSRIGRPSLIVVGEGPGRVEETTGRPFVGASGHLLWRELGKLDVTREECHVTNAALCRGDRDRDNVVAAECCAPRLLRELQDTRPADVRSAEGPETSPPREGPILLLLGVAATRSVLAQRSILRARGFLWQVPAVDARKVKLALRAAHRAPVSERRERVITGLEARALRGELSGRSALPTLHPAFILRADAWAPVWRADLKRAVRWTRGDVPTPHEEEAPHRIGGLEVLRGLGPVVSLDVETAAPDAEDVGADVAAHVPDVAKEKARRDLATHVRLARLLCVGVSDGERTAVIWPWRKRYARGLAKWLRSREAVVFHNGI